MLYTDMEISTGQRKRKKQVYIEHIQDNKHKLNNHEITKYIPLEVSYTN